MISEIMTTVIQIIVLAFVPFFVYVTKTGPSEDFL